jgi:hypothetical protein
MPKNAHTGCIEKLESRSLLSGGNVSVTVDAGLTAHLMGDNQDNNLALVLAPGIGYYIVGQHGTLINGKQAIAIQTSAALHFDIHTGNGKDTVAFSGVFATQNLSIDTGNGDDSVILSQTTHYGNVSILTGNGNDTIVLSAIHLSGNLNIDTGNGKDSITVPNPIQIDGSSTIDGGKGKNSLAGASGLSVGGSSVVAHTTALERVAGKKKKQHH